MLTVLPQTGKDVVAVRVSGKLSGEDFDAYRSLLRVSMQVYGSARLYFEMVDFEGWELGSFAANALFDLTHGHRYGRVAMVGERQWQHWAAKLVDPIKRAGVRYFDLAEREQALHWVMAEPR